MILTVTPNAAMDKTYVVRDFRLDKIHRPSEFSSTPGGKGINVSRVLKELGRPSFATGFIGGSVGDSICAGLEMEGIQYDFVKVPGDSRLCIQVVDPKNGTQTEINELGPEISEVEVNKFYDKFREIIGEAVFLILSGSCPPGVPVDFYSQLIQIAKKNGVKCVLDSSGDHMKEAVQTSPYMIKPNVNELSQLVGRELMTLEEIAIAAKELRTYGVSIIAVTMGRSGAMVTDGVQAWKAVPPAIEFASAVGSGDSFVASFLDSVMSGNSLEESLVAGTAAGAANAMQYGAGFVKRDKIIEMKEEIKPVMVG